MTEPSDRPPRGYSWPPFEPGHELSTQHGANSDRKLRPLVDAHLAELELVAPWAMAPRFRHMAVRWAYAEAECSLRRAHVDANGVQGDDGGDLPGIDRWHRAEARAAKAAEALGLTPTAMARLLSSLSSIDGPAAVSGLEALRAAGAELRAAAGTPALPAGGEDAVEGGADEAEDDVDEDVHRPLAHELRLVRPDGDS